MISARHCHENVEIGITTAAFEDASLTKAEVVALVFVVLHRSQEDIVGRQGPQSF